MGCAVRIIGRQVLTPKSKTNRKWQAPIWLSTLKRSEPTWRKNQRELKAQEKARRRHEYEAAQQGQAVAV